MSLQPAVSSQVNYTDACRLIREYGRRLNGPAGYSVIVFTNGCFDLLHPGHLQVFSRCRELAGQSGAVVVGLNSDESCARLKGPGRPIMDEDARATMVVHLKYVDHVITFEEDTPIKLIEALSPDVIVKGGDYDMLNVVGRNIAPVDLAKFIDNWSTSKIIKKIKEET